MCPAPRRLESAQRVVSLIVPRQICKFVLIYLILSAPVHAQGSMSFNWTHTLGGSGTDQGNAIGTDASGNVYVAGSTNSVGAGGQDVLLMKYDRSGNLLWAKTWGGANDDLGYGVLVDPNGYEYVVGGTYSFGAGSYDVLLLKFDSAGNVIWARTWGGGSFDVGYDISFDQNGNLAIAAESYTYANCTVLLKFSPDGAFISANTWKGP